MNEIAKYNPGLPGIGETSDVDRLVDQFREAIDRDRREPTLPRLPDAGERRAIEDRHREMARLAQPISYAVADRERAQAALERLFAGIPSMRHADSRGTLAVYMMDMVDLPAFAIERAVDDIKHGRIKDLDPDYAPTSVRIVKIANEYAADCRARCQFMQEVLAIRYVTTPALSDEQVERGQKMLREALQKIDTGEDARLEPIKRRVAERSRAESEAFIERDWKRLGQEPMRTAGGTILISPELAQQVRDRSPELRAAGKRHRGEKP